MPINGFNYTLQPIEEGTLKLIRRAEAVGSEVFVVTIDSPALGNRYGFKYLEFKENRHPNLKGVLSGGCLFDLTLNWDIV